MSLVTKQCLLAEHFGRVEHEWWCSLRRNQDRLLSMLPPDVQNQIFASVTTLTSWTQFPKVQRPTLVHGIEGWCFQRQKSKCLLGRLQQKLIYPFPKWNLYLPVGHWQQSIFFPWSCIFFSRWVLPCIAAIAWKLLISILGLFTINTHDGSMVLVY